VSRVFVTDRHEWRLAVAERLGGVPIDAARTDPVQAVSTATGGRGVDIAVEAAWCDETVEQAAGMARLGGRVILVGISSDDRIALKHSTARRKGLTLKLSRRMKHVYPRAIDLVSRGVINVDDLVSHRFPLAEAPRAFALNAAYDDRVVKIVVDVPAA
jgi:L-iditol 2-dehydrogenase